MGYRIEYAPKHTKFSVLTSKDERKIFILYGILYLVIGIGVTILSFSVLIF